VPRQPVLLQEHGPVRRAGGRAHLRLPRPAGPGARHVAAQGPHTPHVLQSAAARRPDRRQGLSAFLTPQDFD